MQHLQKDIDAIIGGTHGEAFSILGPHQTDDGWQVRAYLPGAESIELLCKQQQSSLGTMQRIHGAGFFSIDLDTAERPNYCLQVHYPEHTETLDDPYSFGTLLGELDIHLLSEGNHKETYRVLGAQCMRYGDVDGVRFALWAPNASRVAVVGDFNHWNSSRHPMRLRHTAGVWEVFIPALTEGAAYKFSILDANGQQLPLKADPLAQGAELRPKTASVVRNPTIYQWEDAAWMEQRAAHNDREAPISIYEVHVGSWKRNGEHGETFLSYREIAEQLVPYALDMGFTHVQLMPVGEFPYDGSWGYQQTGLFAPTCRFGSPEDFQFLVDTCHKAELGILIDWVPGHFPEDSHALAKFDGTALYEHADPRRGFQPDWNTLIYNFGRTEVSNFLTASARHWLDRYHVDGLRVDAVASMLYLDYSRKDGEWLPNEFGDNKNLEAIALLQKTNTELYGDFPGTMSIAEESTSWPGVSKPVHEGGLGFGFKWNMGWMNDTLRYMSREPIHRQHHHSELTFGITYAFSENFVLPLSHDEVVHGKGSLINKMPGDRWQKFANLRAYYGYMWAHPGKKLLFQGGEFAQEREWNHDQSIDWHLLEQDYHSGVQKLVRALNNLYKATPALHQLDCESAGFRWQDHASTHESVFVFERKDREGNTVVIVSNLTPVPHKATRIGVPKQGLWQEAVNTDDTEFGGSGIGNAGGVASFAVPWHDHPYSIEITIPPLATVIFKLRD